jgi:Pentapeptide repeats (8 copies)
MAVSQRWRSWVVLGLAGAAGVATGSALSWRGLAGLAIIAGAALVVIAWVMPGRLAPPVPDEDLAKITDPKARLEAADGRLRLRNDLRNGPLQLLAVLAVLAGAVLGFQQLAEDRTTAAADRELTRQGQASERFTRAISQLGDKRVETRIGGIYGLAQVAEQAPGNNGPVGEVLVAYVNRLPRPKTPPMAPLSEHAPDLQAALTVLTQHDKNEDGTKDYAWAVHRLDLHALGLRDANLGGAILDGADLGRANLYGADLHSAGLRDANLRGADLRDAGLGVAILNGADLSGADLSGTNLSQTHLRGAKADHRTVWPVGFDWRRAGVEFR